MNNRISIRRRIVHRISFSLKTHKAFGIVKDSKNKTKIDKDAAKDKIIKFGVLSKLTLRVNRIREL